MYHMELTFNESQISWSMKLAQSSDRADQKRPPTTVLTRLKEPNVNKTSVP